MNYDAFIERDLDAIPAVIGAFRADHTTEQTWTAVTRFAVLAFAPSQHSKHALLACLSAWDLRAAFGERFDDAIVECAKYAAASRQPWSEPPMLDPPKLASDQRGHLEDLRAAIAASDRLRAERWLASRYADPDLAHDYFTAASDDFEDLGHKLIVATAAWRLADLLGEKGRYAMLRVGVWEMAAYGGREPGVGDRSTTPDLESLCASLVTNIVADGGDIVSAHELFLFDAALQTGDDTVIRRVCDHLRDINPTPTPDRRLPASEPPVYRFARDYGACLKAHAVANRLHSRFPNVDFGDMLAAVHQSLDTAPSFEGMSFA
ncbi:MAG TPA: hypothetical protein VN380_10930 [Thermoanaerobaculia bacterium]|jgi:hypothetical protein|nr:hypothetical protein [Thermoanaerobaculia bacterium]